ncbi:hypothetical protein [Glutamicibacter sp. JC586]|uniref:hypothetical protein n=1 Tax=Glutamicibacter sp. JC586 TaxID=2590552 RepID=UPI00135B6EED|nr:hypothetical protein [Glutamicibacter sp. JC586]
MKRTLTGRLVAVAVLSVIAYSLLYFLTRPLLPEDLARHAGPDGVGYSQLWITVLIIGALATLCLSIGIIVYRDFVSLGHWYPGPKAIAACFLAAGFGILGLGTAMILTVLGREAEELGSQPIAMGLLGLGLVFASSAGLLAKMLPRAKEETLSD